MFCEGSMTRPLVMRRIVMIVYFNAIWASRTAASPSAEGGVTRFFGGRWVLPHLLVLGPIVPNHAENRDPAKISPEKTPDCCTFAPQENLGTPAEGLSRLFSLSLAM